MAAQPYILARTMKAAHTFAREDLGLAHGQYRIVNSPSTVKSVRGADLYLVPGYQNRFDRFAMKGAIRWTRMNVIHVDEQAQEPAVPDDLVPEGVQLVFDESMIITAEEASAFFADTDPTTEETLFHEADMARHEIQPDPVVTEELESISEEPDRTGQRRSRCKACGTLHYRDEPCPDDPIPGA